MKPLDPVLKAIADAGDPHGPSLFEMPADQARAIFNEIAVGKPHDQIPGVETEDRTLDTASGALRVRIYRPALTARAATIVFLHGGGYALGDLDLMDDEARLLSAVARAVVVSVNYRLCPEHRLPAAHDDAVAALRWAHIHIGELGGDANLLCVAGESAGANLAATAAIAMRDEGVALAGQLLIVPAPDLAALGTLRDDGVAYPMLRPRDIRAIAHNCLPPGEAGDAYPFSAAHAEDLSGLAPATIGLAGHCPTLQIGRGYARALQAAGVDVRLMCFDNMFHPFFAFTGVSPGAKSAAESLVRAFSASLTARG